MIYFGMLLLILLMQEPTGFPPVDTKGSVIVGAMSTCQTNVTTKQCLAAYMESVPFAPKPTQSFRTADEETTLRWIKELIDWTETLIGSSYDQGTFQMDEEARGYMLSLLSQYYTPDQAERLVSLRYRKTDVGLYEYRETESLSRIDMIDRELRVTTKEHADKYEVVITGYIKEQLDETEWFWDPVEEHFFFDKRDWRISGMNQVRS